MKNLKINIVLPFIPIRPGGGLRVMFEYANYLADFGHDVTVYYPCSIYYRKTRTPKNIKYFYYKYFKSNVPNWFSWSANVKTAVIQEISDETIKDGDIILSSWWSLVYHIRDLSWTKGKRFNLIQDIESWLGHEDLVKASYAIPGSTNVVIATYLFNYLQDVTGQAPYKVPFAIDEKKFFIKVPIRQRNPLSVVMLHSLEPRKGTKFGMEALVLLKQKYPQLQVTLFGVAPRPVDLPEGFAYFEKPGNLNQLFNGAAIFLGPSNQEGCALPPMEAMHGGCAIVCTDIDGHKDYATDGVTALMARPQDPEDMADKVSQLIEDAALRNTIAQSGNDFIRRYTWEESSRVLEGIFNNSCNKPEPLAHQQALLV